MLDAHLFLQSQRVPPTDRSFPQLVSLPRQPESSVTDDNGNRENDGTMARINVTSCIPSSNMLGNKKVFSKNKGRNTVVPELCLYLDVYPVHE